MESILGALLTAGLPTKHLARGHPAAAAETKLGEPVHIYIYIYIKTSVGDVLGENGVGRMVWGECVWHMGRAGFGVSCVSRLLFLKKNCFFFFKGWGSCLRLLHLFALTSAIRNARHASSPARPAKPGRPVAMRNRMPENKKRQTPRNGGIWGKRGGG